MKTKQLTVNTIIRFQTVFWSLIIMGCSSDAPPIEQDNLPMYESPPTATMSNADPPPTLIQNDPSQTEPSQAGPMTETEMPDRPSEGSSGEMMESPGDETSTADPFVPAPPTMYRLTRAQYRNVIADAFGADIQIPDDLEPDTPLHGYASIGAGELTISARAVEQYEAAAQTILENFLAR